MKLTALAGGVGAAKLLRGLAKVQDPRDLTVVVNTGDDIEMHGLSVSPDLDIVTYTLADAVDPATGWGISGDSFAALESLRRFGQETWFQLGDRDLATHIHRTVMLRSGARLSEVAESIRRAFGVATRILPMSDQPVRTMIETETGRLHFQEYLVRERAQPLITGIEFEGLEDARATPEVIQSLEEAEGIVICPSNPLISIGPILAVAGIREVLQRRRDSVIAVSPIVGGKSLKGPSDRMLRQLGFEASATGVARMYQDIAGSFVIDRADEAHREAVEELEMSVAVRDTIMSTWKDKSRLARDVLELIKTPRAAVDVS